MVIICIINLYQKMNLSQCHLHFKIDQILGWDWWHFLLIYRTVARGLAGWPMAHLVFGRIKDKDCKINHLRHIFFPGPPGFEMLSAALIYSKVSHKILRPVLIYILVLISRDKVEFWVVDVYVFLSFLFTEYPQFPYSSSECNDVRNKSRFLLRYLASLGPELFLNIFITFI